MPIKFKASHVLTAVLMFLSCALSAPFAAAEDRPANAQPDASAKAKTPTDVSGAKVEPSPSPSPVVLFVQSVSAYTDDAGSYGKPGIPNKLGSAGMGDGIVINIPGLSAAIEQKQIDPNKLILYLNGRGLKDVHPESIGWDSLMFKLERTSAAMDAWNALLGRPTLDSRRPVIASVGYPNAEPFKLLDDKQTANLNLIVYSRRWAVVSLFGLLIIFLLFWKYGRKELLRDSGPPEVPEDKEKPYSLAKVQVAWWFFLIVGCFLLIYMITGQFTMSEQALILMGIGTGTALGSAMIDANKRSSADSELYTLRPEKKKLDEEIEQLKAAVRELEVKIPKLETKVETHENAMAGASATAADKDLLKASSEALKTSKDSLKANKIELAEKLEKLKSVELKIADAASGLEKPVSEGFVKDLVTDNNGVCFHRFQMIVWTVVLGVLFLVGVYKDLAMPEFSSTMLALMGISAGTYLGFKIPERQS